MKTLMASSRSYVFHYLRLSLSSARHSGEYGRLSDESWHYHSTHMLILKPRGTHVLVAEVFSFRHPDMWWCILFRTFTGVLLHFYQLSFFQHWLEYDTMIWRMHSVRCPTYLGEEDRSPLTQSERDENSHLRNLCGWCKQQRGCWYRLGARVREKLVDYNVFRKSIKIVIASLKDVTQQINHTFPTQQNLSPWPSLLPIHPLSLSPRKE